MILLRYKLSIFITASCMISSGINAQGDMMKARIEKYVRQYQDVAVQEMYIYRIPASITLAQGILESSAGNSPLAKDANNHFGIKCHKEWTGETFTYDDDAKGECFRKYKDAIESFRDHSYFLTQRVRYKALFELDITDYKGWAKGLKAAGYATNPKYPELLIKYIEDYGLNKLDDGKKLPPLDEKKDSVPPIDTTKTITPATLATYEVIEEGPSERKVLTNNGLKYIIARKGDTFFRIATDFNIYTYQLYVYNDLPKSARLKEGDMVYLERKRAKGVISSHIVIKGENTHSISQKYGIQEKKLCKHNGIREGQRLKEGQKLKLK